MGGNRADVTVRGLLVESRCYDISNEVGRVKVLGVVFS
jgi:hypothetical protein